MPIYRAVYADYLSESEKSYKQTLSSVLVVCTSISQIPVARKVKPLTPSPQHRQLSCLVYALFRVSGYQLLWVFWILSPLAGDPAGFAGFRSGQDVSPPFGIMSDGAPKDYLPCPSLDTRAFSLYLLGPTEAIRWDVDANFESGPSPVS